MRRTKRDSAAVRAARPSGGWRSLGAVTACRREVAGVTLECGRSQVRVSFERGGMVRVRLAPDGNFGRDHSWAVIESDATVAAWRFVDGRDHLELHGAETTVRIQRDPCRISFHTPQGEWISGDEPSKGMFWDGGEFACWKTLRPDERFFGLGEKGLPFDKRETFTINWNHDASAHEPWTDPLYQTHPFLIALNPRHCYGLFLDNTWRSWFDLGKSSRSAFGFGADGGELNYYFIPGPTPADVVQRYALLVGTTPLPPLWSLGYQQCRWSYENAQRVRKLAHEFRRRRIPCDTIYLDIDYMDGFRCFTWSRKSFPNPQKLLKELAREGFKVVPIIDPGIKVDRAYAVYKSGVAGGHFADGPDGKPYVGKVWPGDSVYPDFTRAETRRWWGEQYRGFVDCGMAGFWNDMNEPSDFTHADKTIPLDVQFDNDGEPADHRAAHNIYGMQMARATFEGLRRLRPNERPFVLTRAGYAGVQRYAAVWTGDNASTWEHLRMSIPMLLNLGVSGVPFIGADIGGFRNRVHAELYTRWLQLGIFYPLCRTHTGGGPEQDPWSHGPRAEKINRRSIELRYELLPYLYTEMHRHEVTGLPVMRPAWLEHPAWPEALACEHEFHFGPRLFVAPVVHEGAATRKFWLPPGAWCDFISGQRREGGCEVEMPVSLDTIPIFARAGAVIPMQPVVQYVDNEPMRELILVVYPGDGVGEWRQDDGRSYGYREGEFVRETYAAAVAGSGGKRLASLTLTERLGQARFCPKACRIEFAGMTARPRTVTVGGRPLVEQRAAGRFFKSTNVWRYDAKSRRVLVRVASLAVDEPVEVRGGAA